MKELGEQLIDVHAASELIAEQRGFPAECADILAHDEEELAAYQSLQHRECEAGAADLENLSPLPGRIRLMKTISVFSWRLKLT